MDLHLALSGPGTLQRRLYLELRRAILDGRLASGEELPSTRDLARRLELSRNTVLAAYERLTAEGFIAGEVGAGTFVTSPLPDRGRPASSTGVLQPRKLWLDRDLCGVTPPRPRAPFDFGLGSPDPSLFFWDEWRRHVARQLRGRRPLAGYPAPEGDPRLREAVARQLGRSRAVRAEAEDVLICAGAQQAFDLIGRVLLEPGDCVAVEDPGYPQLRQVLEAQGARVVPVPVDGEGLDVERIPIDARLVCVTPSHQFPLGTAMSLRRRLALLAWSERRGAAIVEDDYDSEFRFDGRPLDTLQSLDRSGRVLYVGTFSKVLLPTLRLGFLVAPASLRPALRSARRLSDSHGPPDAQRALAEIIDEGIFARHLRRLHREYHARRDRLLDALTREFGHWLEPLPASAGLHLSAYCRDSAIDAEAWAVAASRVGVAIEPLSAYQRLHPRAGMTFGYGLIRPERIAEGVARLASCRPRTRGSR